MFVVFRFHFFIELTEITDAEMYLMFTDLNNKERIN